MKFKSIRAILNTTALMMIFLTALSLFNISLVHITRRTENTYRRALSLDKKLVSHLANEDSALNSVEAFNVLITRYDDLQKALVADIPNFDSDLLKQRRRHLARLFEANDESYQLHARVRRLLPELIVSVRYIHEHHIAYLKNMLRRGHSAQDYDVGEEFQRSPVKAAPELDIIGAAVTIQNHLLDVFTVFNKMQSGEHPSVLQNSFSEHIKHFYTAVNTFEDYSLDAQDGLLVEEMLLTGRKFEAAYLRLLQIETLVNDLTAQLAINQKNLIFSLEADRLRLGHKTQQLTNNLHAIQYLSSALFVFLLVVLMITGRRLVINLHRTGNETKAIQNKITYQIPIHSNEFEEFRVIHEALNTMANTIEQQMVDLETARTELAHRVAERTSELEQANLSLIREIEDRTLSEKERRELESKLIRAKKMEAIGTLAGGVAHDLNNILSGVVSYPDLILSGLSEKDPMHGWLTTIKSSGEKAAAIVQDLLTLARRGLQTTEVVNLRTIIEEYLESPTFALVRAYHPNVIVHTDLLQDTAPIKGSQIHLQKTIMNLVSNAAEAMPDGGVIKIATENVYVDATVEGYDDILQGDYVRLSVADTGVGIAEEDIDRIFEPFFTKKKMGRSGTGLGMTVVWGTVKDHGGHIDVESEDGRGTRFSLFFPITREAYAQGLAPLPLNEISGHGETILVVDDVAEQRQIAQEMLTRMGYRVETAKNGQAAVDFLKTQIVDLVVLDMIMPPGMDGLETFRRITVRHPGTKAIIASGYAETDRVREAQRMGAGIYIRKPYTLQKIGLAVKQALAG